MSLTIGKLVDGNYAFFGYGAPHHHSAEEDSHNGAYGPGGIFRLKLSRGLMGSNTTMWAYMRAERTQQIVPVAQSATTQRMVVCGLLKRRYSSSSISLQGTHLPIFKSATIANLRRTITATIPALTLHQNRLLT